MRAASIRRFASLLAALSLVVVATTGVLCFVSAYSDRLAGVHSVAGAAFIAAALLHIAHNARSLLAYIPATTTRAPSRALVAAGIVTAVVLAGSLARVGPIRWLLELGRSARTSGTLDYISYRTIAVDPGADDVDGPTLELDLKAGPAFRFTEPTFGYEIVPQMALWVEDENGNYIDTLYVTQKEANGTYSDAHGDTLPRPAALPVWRHRRDPSHSGASVPDAVSGASPVDNTYVLTRAHTKLTRFHVFLEVNSSFDYNDYYSRDAFPNDRIYHDSGNPAQPSIIYRASVDLAAPQRFTLMEPIGHGHHSGANGDIDPDLSHVTTALHIIDRAVIEVRAGGSISAARGQPR